MNLIKHLEFFNPMELEENIHIIGVGAIGSTLVEMLVRLGLTNIHLFDFDTVTAHNIANQQYFNDDVDKKKLDAIYDTCKKINPDVEITLHYDGWGTGTKLDGYVFLAVDSIDIRKAIAIENKYNSSIIAMFDFRMGLQDAQHYSANWSDEKSKETFLDYMDFTHDEAKDAQPVSACGTTLSVISTIRGIVALGVSNFINFVKENSLKKIILLDAFAFKITAF